MNASLGRAASGVLLFAGCLMVFAGCNNGSSSSSPSPNPTASGCGTLTKNSRVYITNASGAVSSNPNSPDTVDVFLISSLVSGTSSNVTPCQQFNSATFSSAYGIAVDSSANIWMTDTNSSTVLEFSPGANGSPSATRTIASSAMVHPYGLALDGAGNIYVTSQGGGTSSLGSGAILEFAASASGNVNPTRQIMGSNTGLSLPAGIAVHNGQIVVANNFGNTVEIFGSSANGNATPLRVITGASSGLNAPLGVSVGPGGGIYVANNSGNSITIYGLAGSAPVRTIVGNATGLALPSGLALDGSSKIYVAQNGPPATSSNPTGGLEIFAPSATGNANPLVNVSGVGFSASAVAIY
jgi:hypothetical protein